MIFVSLYKFRKRPTKADVDKATRVFKAAEKQGVKTLGVWWTFGRYDAVRIFQARNEKQAMKVNLQLEAAGSETLVAVPRDEAVKLV